MSLFFNATMEEIMNKTAALRAAGAAAASRHGQIDVLRHGILAAGTFFKRQAGIGRRHTPHQAMPAGAADPSAHGHAGDRPGIRHAA